jgi:hypothetical protein
MNLEDFSNVVKFEGITQITHDFYVATFADQQVIGDQQFIDHTYGLLENLDGLWFRNTGSDYYFAVAKGTVIPRDFATRLIKVDEPETITEPSSPVEE